MKKEKATQYPIEDIINSFDGAGRAEPTPFFYTRVQANLDKRLEPSASMLSWIMRPAVSFASFSLLLVLNIAAITHFTKTDKQPVVQSAPGIQSFAQEYNLSVTSVYADKTNR